MPTPSIDALSPLDGRYAGKLAPVRHVFSEAGLMRERVRVECAWFLALAAGAAAALEWLHFGCTSEDINNLAYALMLKHARAALLLPKLDAIGKLLEILVE